MESYLIPSLNLKTSELFFKWFTDSDKTQELIRESIQDIKNGKIFKLNELQLNKDVGRYSLNYSNNNGHHTRPKSPTVQSPPMSPINRHNLPNSPKSPKRKFNIQNNLINNNQSKQQQQQQQQQSQVKLSSTNIQNELILNKEPVLNTNIQPNKVELKIDSIEKQTNKNETTKLVIEPTLVQQSPKIVGDSLINNNKKSTNKQQDQQLKKQNIPQFYFPNGKPQDRQKDDFELLRAVQIEFNSIKDGKLTKEYSEKLAKAIGLPKYWKMILFRACLHSINLNTNLKQDYLTYSQFELFWKKLSNLNRATLFVKLMVYHKQLSNNNQKDFLEYEDWELLMQDIVDTHPGLKFLHDHKEFHSRYIKTVIARIYYYVNRSWSGKITVNELKQSNFLTVLESLEYEDDINLIKEYFSYEHFYVIYCKFWELDKDHDLYISKEDLYRHNNYAVSSRVIDRIFSGTVIRNKDWRDNLMSYYDFVWFLISEEDKRNQTSIEYWFRVLDIDGDGILSMYELEYFYNEQIELMKERQIEFMPFIDLLCQILDLVKPRENGKIRLKDLKQCKLTNVFFDTFINLEKYLEYEQRDPFANLKDYDGPELSDWQKYAAEEYENLVSEDNPDNQDMYNNYDDDFEDEPLIFNNNKTNVNNTQNVQQSKQNNGSSFISNRTNYDER